MKRRGFLLIVVLSFTSLVFGQNDPPAPPPPAAKLPSTISGGVLNGKATSLPKPAYPPAAKAVNAEGAVSVQVLIDEQGAVISASAVSGHPLLRAAATEAARAATFSPTLLQGQPVKVSGVITYNFVLPKKVDPDLKGVLKIIPPEDHDKIWAFGLLLSFVQSADSETIRMIGDESELLTILEDLKKDLPAEMESYRPTVEKLSSKDSLIRSEAAREFLVMLRNELDGEKAWQLNVGEKLGFTIVELLKQKIRYVKSAIPYNADTIKLYLGEINDLVAAAPKGSSAEFLSHIKKFASFASSPNLASDGQFAAMIEALEPLFGAFDKK